MSELIYGERIGKTGTLAPGATAVIIDQAREKVLLTRRRNVEGSFQARSGFQGVSVIVIDDVATTGSTISACASALKSAGASSVWGLVLAREA